jgi:myo-inositol-1(or 4)-monophosphatase
LPEPDIRSPQQLEQDHDLLCAAVRDAGALALSYFQTDVKQWDKGDDDPVSEADHAVNDLLHERLQGMRPNYGWLSEETDDDPARLECDFVWVVDPIDGTRAFLKGKPHFTICVALVYQGEPICAAVFNPATDEFFEAVAEQGARLNGQQISPSNTANIPNCRMAAFGPMFKHKAWPEPWPAMEIVDRNSVAYRIVLVANGFVDACMALNSKNDWDLAAADLIVREAGGRMTTHDGRRFVYNKSFTKHRSLLAAGPRLYRALFDKVGKLTLP